MEFLKFNNICVCVCVFLFIQCGSLEFDRIHSHFCNVFFFKHNHSKFSSNRKRNETKNDENSGFDYPRNETQQGIQSMYTWQME